MGGVFGWTEEVLEGGSGRFMLLDARGGGRGFGRGEVFLSFGKTRREEQSEEGIIVVRVGGWEALGWLRLCWGRILEGRRRVVCLP